MLHFLVNFDSFHLINYPIHSKNQTSKRDICRCTAQSQYDLDALVVKRQWTTSCLCPIIVNTIKTFLRKKKSYLHKKLHPINQILVKLNLNHTIHTSVIRILDISQSFLMFLNASVTNSIVLAKINVIEKLAILFSVALLGNIPITACCRIRMSWCNSCKMGGVDFGRLS